MSDDRFCDDLPTRPRPDDGLVLVTGATGYIGGRLVPELLARGYRVRIMVRAPAPELAERWPACEIAIADAARPEDLRAALRGVTTAYYLIHALLLGSRRFESVDHENARNFRAAAEAEGVKRIIYLGGLGDVRTRLSAHLRSRMEVAAELCSDAVRTTVLRAAIIMGAGGASYEIIHHLVKRLPVIIIPSWANTKCQPIAIRDVIRYLVAVLETPEAAGRSFDIGGPDILTYGRMMQELAEILGKRRWFLRVPDLLSPIPFYAYIAGFLTPVPAPITRSLMEGLRNDVVCEDEAIRELVPDAPLTYKAAVLEAMSLEERDEIHTRWSDAYPPAHELAMKFEQLGHTPRYVASYSLDTATPADALFRSICRIGGHEGWFTNNWMWRLRGLIDTTLMGVGTSRGRRSSSELRVNDVIDFWRVERLIPDRQVLLRAEMRLPGRAWLEFAIDPVAAANRLRVTANFDTASWFGHVYWHIFLPFHDVLFKSLIRQIDRRAAAKHSLPPSA